VSRIVISDESEKDLLQIGDYIANKLKSRRSALTTIKGIRQAIDKLEDFPLIGTPLSAVAGIDTDYRFVGYRNYLAFYRPKDGKVYVDRVLYSRRDCITILLGDLLDEDGV